MGEDPLMSYRSKIPLAGMGRRFTLCVPGTLQAPELGFMVGGWGGCICGRANNALAEASAGEREDARVERVPGGILSAWVRGVKPS